MNQKVLFFTASWCPWCQELKPQVEEIKKDIEVVECDLSLPEPRAQAKETYKLKSLPTLIFMEDDVECGRWNADDNEGTPVADWVRLTLLWREKSKVETIRESIAPTE